MGKNKTSSSASSASSASGTKNITTTTSSSPSSTSTANKRWNFDLSTEKQSSLPEPFGFGVKSSSSEVRTQNPRELAALQIKKSWDVAKGPAQSILMTAIMLWMSGGLHIVGIMITFMSIWNPTKAMLGVNSAFERFTDLGWLIPQKLVYIGLNGVSLGVALYKCYSMGILPTPSDWASFLPVPEMQELSFGSAI